MTIGCIIQARMSSTRLPGKVLMKIDDKNSALFTLINQLKYSKKLDKIILATTNLKNDDAIIDLMKKMKITTFRGDPNNVLDRYYKCAKKFSCSIIVRITADNPLIDPTIVDKTVEKFTSNSFDCVSNVYPRTYPYGTEIEVFSFQALERVWNQSTNDYEKEHVTPFFYRNPEKFRIGTVNNKKNLSSLRWTMDTMDDLIFIKKITSKIKKRPILMNDILKLLSKEPKLINLIL